jgi:hypothetical protein
MATIEFSSDSMKRTAETVADVLVVIVAVTWTDMLLGFNIVPGWINGLLGWITLPAVGWLTWSIVRGHKIFK